MPRPDAVAEAHSQRLVELIDTRIQAAGAIPFSEFMDLALYAPGLGYYMAGAQKFGSGGDFTTAPETSPMFGECVARQCRPILAATNGQVLELGAGSGRLAAAVLDALDDIPELEYLILEPSAELRHRQRQTLEALLDGRQLERVRWLDALPENFVGVIVANEVMDALPVERIRIDSSLPAGAARLGVAGAAGAWHEQAMPLGDALAERVQATLADLPHPLPDGYTTEVSMLTAAWLGSLANALSQGVILLIDYGYPRAEYYLPERQDGTLMCYYRHHAHADAYRYPGLQDITSHVDFTRLAEASDEHALDFIGYTNQASFLLANGLASIAERAVAEADGEAQVLEITRAVKQLTLPGEMGERFQAIAFGRGWHEPLAGFLQTDLSHRL